MMRLPLTAVTLLLLVTTPSVQAADWIWWEAEQPKTTNFPDANPFAPANQQEADALSEGKWIGAGGDWPQTLFLEYEVTVPADAEYQFYARKFWKHGPFRWRFDGQPWRECGKEIALLDSVELRKFTVANWVALGAVKLSAGKHSLRMELLEKSGAVSFDCFVLSTGAFTPNGKLKPGQKLNRAPAGWFAFEPDPDAYSPSPIDLRSLNEKSAGDDGFIQVRGDQFIHETSGQPVRFWAVNAGPNLIGMDKASVDALAKFLAKRGVNLIRMHGGVWDAQDITRLNPDYLDHYHYFVAAMKREGIYSCLSIYFPLWITLKPGDIFEGYSEKQTHPFSLLFFNERFQQIYRDWWKTLLTTKNPYTNLPPNQDPAVAMLELVNEDSYLFWTFVPYERIPSPQIELLEKQFGDWLAGKYGTLQKAFAAWGGESTKGDDEASGRAGFVGLWAMANQPTQRSRDTAEFLTRHQQAFFQSTYTYLKDDLGFKGAIYGSNWITADARVLGPLDKYSNTVGDFMDRHGYFSAPHEGPRAGYTMDVGDTYDDRSALLLDGQKASLPLFDIFYNGKPSTISEINWTGPNRFRADMPLATASYALLQGTNGLFFFALSGPGWDQTVNTGPVQTPVTMGQFPAAALIYRKGLVKQGQTVADVQLRLADLLALKGAPISAPQNVDDFRAKEIPAGQAMTIEQVASIDPLAYLVGRVQMNITDTGGPSTIVDLSAHIDRSKKLVRSSTDELAWDYGKGLMTLNAPAAQGVTGFLAKAGAVQLGDVTIQSPMDYGAITLVALDDQPLATSKKMLLQVASEETNYGWSAPGIGKRAIRSLGAPPIVVRTLAGTVTLAGGKPTRITALDFNGYPAKQIEGAKVIPLLPDTLYYLIER